MLPNCALPGYGLASYRRPILQIGSYTATNTAAVKSSSQG